MPDKELIWIVGPGGKEELVDIRELDDDVLHRQFKPIGGFCYKVDSFLQLPLPPAPFYIKDWLPKQGRLEIYGQPKSGKSFMAAQMARCIGSGEPFLGIPTQKARVLLIQSELGIEVLQHRLKLTGKRYNNVYIGTTFAMKLDAQSGKAQLEEAIDTINPQVVIFDPFYKMIRGDENDVGDVRKVLDYLDQMMFGFKFSVVIMHHPGKDIERGGRGSSILADWHDTVIELRTVKRGDEKRARLMPKLMRHAQLPPVAIEAKMENFEFVQSDLPPTIEEKIYAYMLPDVQYKPKELLDLGSRESVQKCLAALVRKGMIERVQVGVYVKKEKSNDQQRS